MKKTKITPIELKAVRESYGASSPEYKAALENVDVKTLCKEHGRRNMPRGRSLATRLVEDDQNSNMVLNNKISAQRRSSQIRLEKRILKRGAEKVN